MNWLRSLTVTQSLVAIFVSGFAIALIFATVVVLQDLRDYRDVRHDDRILRLAQAIEGVVHEMQIERGLTAAWIAGEASFAERIATQRRKTDGLVSEMTWAATSFRDVADPGDQLRAWLQAHRAAVDAGRLDHATHLNRMTQKNREMIALIAQSAAKARSASLSRELREDVVLFLAKDALGLERALGATILAMIEGGRPVDIALVNRLLALSGEREFAFGMHRILSERDGHLALGLLERMPSINRLSEWRERIVAHVLNETNIPQTEKPLPAPGRWFDTATEVVNSLRAIETEGERRIRAELSAEAAEIRSAAQRKVLLFVGLTIGFGLCALVTLRSVRDSIKGLIGSICRLSVNAREAEIPTCHQADLEQIASALRVLRSIQIEQQNSHDVAESLRQRFDTHVHDMLQSVAKGDTKKRIDLLDLDGPSAVLARGINNLLDQLEVRRRGAA